MGFPPMSLIHHPGSDERTNAYCTYNPPPYITFGPVNGLFVPKFKTARSPLLLEAPTMIWTLLTR